MKIAVACGGTGGHIFPGLATAQVLADRGHEVTLWMAGKDVEAQALEGWPGRTIQVPAQGFPTRFSLRGVRSAWSLARAVRTVRGLMVKEQPEVLLAMGSYASVGPVGAAISLRIPYVLHEANVVPGRAIKLFSRRAGAICGCFEETRYYLRGRDLTITGMPLRRPVVEAAKRHAPHSGGKYFHLLVMGGSRGAHALNELISEALIHLHRRGVGIEVTHLTGTEDEMWVENRYDAAGMLHTVRAFTNRIEDLYARADFAICRSGASTCAELAAFALPALLVPFPFAVKNHQMANARVLEKAGAADVVPESDLTVEWLTTYIERMCRVEERRISMARAAAEWAFTDGAERLADQVERQAR